MEMGAVVTQTMTQTMTETVTEAAETVRGVKPETLGAPTPCAEWDVRALLGHLLQVVSALALAGRDGAVPADQWSRDLMSQRWAETFDDEARRAVAAWADPAAVGRQVDLGGAVMPAGFVVAMLAGDLVLHGWDLARATGQEFCCTEAAAAMTLEFLENAAEQGRGVYFAAAVPVPDDAPTLSRALALSGRDPGWTPPTGTASTPLLIGKERRLPTDATKPGSSPV